jgi:Ni,Fe-hydrogenase III component G
MEAGQLPALARTVKDEGGQLVALWGSDDRHLGEGFGIHAAFLTSAGLAWVSSGLSADAPAYPDLAHIFPQADRMQRATHDLLGIRAEGAVDDRKWLRHAAWAEDEFPLRKDFVRLTPHASLAGRVPAGMPEPLDRRGACSANSPSRPFPLH